MRRHVKIVCTLGPASSSPEIVQKMLNAGMDIARFNLAYSTPEEHSRLISEVRLLSRRLRVCTGILLDLPGLKRRGGDTKAVFSQRLPGASQSDRSFYRWGNDSPTGIEI